MNEVINKPEPLAAVPAEMRGIAGNMETAAKKFDVERQDERRGGASGTPRGIHRRVEPPRRERRNEMNTEPSPRPWRVIDKPNGQLVLYTSIVKNSDGLDVAFVCRSADAALIVAAVNNYSPIPKTELLMDAVSENIALRDERDRLRAAIGEVQE